MILEEYIELYECRLKCFSNAIIKHDEMQDILKYLKELKDFRDNGAKPWFTAKWVRDRGKSRKCSRCEFSINEDDAYIFHFCPDCGAQMEVENA